MDVSSLLLPLAAQLYDRVRESTCRPVREGLERFIDRTQVDEVIITGAMFDPAARKRSVTIAAEAMRSLQPAGSRNLTSNPPRSSLSSREAVPS